MSVHDYIIDDQDGASVRSDLNKTFAAIVSNNSSPTEPPTTYAFMWWASTSDNLLKQRNSSNTGWNTIKPLDGDTFDVDVELLANRSTQANLDFDIALL